MIQIIILTLALFFLGGDMNASVRDSIEKGNLVLFLGAGASITSLDRQNRNILTGGELSKLLATEAGFEYNNEPLPVVYSAVKKTLGSRLDDILEERYRHCKPSKEYQLLSRYAWARIYTLNIDDAFDAALLNSSAQRINIQHMKSQVRDQDQLFRSLDYIKLNGSSDRINEGLIFSPKEYGSGSANPSLWYLELAEDFFKYKFIFVGTKLNEPLFYHQIERYRAISGRREQRSYVLTPTATEIEINSLDELNLEHIPGTLEDLVSWLIKEFPEPLTANDLAVKRYPELALMQSLGKAEDKEKLAKTFQHVIPVGRSYLTISIPAKSPGEIREFYKGFKPDWQDILDDVPATLSATQETFKAVSNALLTDQNLFVVTGPAGSGKSTLLKQIAIQLADQGITTYFISFPINNLREIVVALETANKSRYCLFYDRLSLIASDVEEILENNIMKSGMFISAESLSVWDRRIASKLEKFAGTIIKLEEITELDAINILAKLEKYGPWTRLSNLPVKQRIQDLLHKSKRQLLIGLLETTLGIGFEEIIERDYSNLDNEIDKLLLVIVGLATANKVQLDKTYASRALHYIGHSVDVEMLCSNMSGILKLDRGYISARHPVYIRSLFERVIEKDEIIKGLLALMEAFTVYGSPVIKKVGRNEGQLFKSLINHSFLKELFRDDQDYILKFYKSFEKRFENDGLFWLQYGLALRDLKDQSGAFEKLRTAFEAYPHPHTEHALAQQELIIASKATTPTAAFALLDTAKKRLESLDKTLRSDDTYPIVSLSEGHTYIIRRFDGDEKAKVVATYYANLLERRTKVVADARLKRAWTKLTKYIVSGEWIEDETIGDYW